ncbi:MAG: hypothetical protein LBE91_13565 [Tannerella sp.]|nr:hypothetical protein [Tannerella sp.]
MESDIFNANLLQVSTLAAQDRAVNGEMSVLVTDRTIGAPISNATVQLFEFEDFRKIKSFITDKNGIGKGSVSEKYVREYYAVNQGNNRLLVFDKKYNLRTYDNEKRLAATILTDRAIYRPGQTIYFKAILYSSKDNDQRNLLKNTSVKVRFYDANHQIISEKSIKSNDFGSLDDVFVIPQGLLNGQFLIECENYGSTSVRVEEYKRPTFEVKFDTVRENYKLNDLVKVQLNAQALAGYSIDNANVQYRVTREVQYRYFRWWYPPVSDTREIGSGVVKTDEDGKTSIEFQALADDVKNDELIYTYTVTADVTDVNGETRTGTLNLNISNKPLLIKTNVPNKLDLDNLDKYTVETTNLNGDATPATVAVEIVALKTPDRILRNRLWNDIIDFQMIPEKEFRRDFPLDAYNNELNPDNFAEKNTVSQWTMDTEKSKKLDLSTLKESGYYKLILSAENRQGITIADTLIFNLTGKKAEKITAMNEWITALKTTGEPGENAEFLVAGGNVDSRVYYEVIHKNKPVASKWIKAGTTPTLLTFPIKEEYRGGFSVQFSMTQENRIYSFSNQINVLFTNKMLDVKLATFRDKLLPGENEKWTMLVSDKKGEKQVAEIAASLYDASLDVFAPHSWANLNSIYNQSFGSYYYSWNTRSVGQVGSPKIFPKNNSAYYMQPIQYVDINWFNGLYRQAFSDYGGIRLRSARAQSENVFNIVETAPMLANEAALDEVVVVGYGVQKKESMTGSVSSIDAMTAPKPEEPLPAPPTTPDLTSIQTRTNFNETAFFYPQLRTNENGEVLIEFTIPEALTRWKLLSFAHTQDFKIGTYTNELITQKQVAISANPPRFFRENDEITLTAKVNNLTESDLDGQALLRLYDAVTMQPVDDMIVSDKTLPFNVKQGGSEGLQWKLKIPAGLQAITYKVTAQAGTHSDGEEKTVPVLTNSMLVTETMPFSVRAGKTKSFTMDKLIHNQSNTLRNYNLTLEYTSAPAWYAVQALPYIMEYPYECAEQTFARYYANTLATTVVNKTPRIKQIFDTWNTLNSSALLSNLEKNQELKQVMLEETPWVMQAKNETESKKRIGLLFDLNRMSNELNRAFNKLKKSQNSDGGFPWFDGNPSSRYITQHIVAGMAHLDKLGAMQEKNAADAQQIVTKGLDYLDNEIWKDYDALIRNKADLTKRQINALHLNYLYAYSFDRHKPANDAGEKAFDYYLSQTEQFWIEFSTYEKAMAALILNRFDKQTTAKKIMASLKEYAQQFEEMGMYWKDNVAGYFWYQAPIETQAILIEAFNEVTADIQSVEEMKIWLLRNKQTNDWKTTKATSEAVYALLMTGGNLLDESKLLEVEIGGKPLEQAVNEPINPEAGTGYVKTSWQGKEITPQMGKLTVKNPNNQGIGWGGLYWQYFEQLDKITSAVTNLKMNKQLFLRVLTEKGEELKPIDGSNRLHVGDLVRVRMELRADRDFEYVHLKDMRAAGFEPVSTVSGHRYQDGLFYYESVKDASNNYFITYLRKGTYVFEYDLRVSHEGDFSNGITTFQCMYAPEFSAHSEGIRVKIE